MEAYFDIISSCSLFTGIKREELTVLLKCLSASVRKFHRNEFILREGDPSGTLGVVLQGNVSILREDIYGARSLISKLSPGDVFGESLAFSGTEFMPVSVVSGQESTVMMIDALRISTGCVSACSFHSRLIRNLLGVLARKNLMFSRRQEITSKRTTRDKLMFYLMGEAKERGSRTFTVPFSRQELADFLGVDRSGLSAEIGKLRRQGVIDCHKSTFKLIRQENRPGI